MKHRIHLRILIAVFTLAAAGSPAALAEGQVTPVVNVMMQSFYSGPIESEAIQMERRFRGREVPARPKLERKRGASPRAPQGTVVRFRRTAE